MARVVALIPDLLFGSNVVGALQAGGHSVRLVSAPDVDPDTDVLVVDLTTDPAARVDAVRGLIGGPGPGPGPGPGRLKSLAFYSHVEADVRALAQDAGFDLVVPRSRMAREGAALVDRLVEPG
jgi:hypothetical protein